MEEAPKTCPQGSHRRTVPGDCQRHPGAEVFGLGSRRPIDTALFRLTKAGTIRRVAQGLDDVLRFRVLRFKTGPLVALGHRDRRRLTILSYKETWRAFWFNWRDRLLRTSRHSLGWRSRSLSQTLRNYFPIGQAGEEDRRGL